MEERIKQVMASVFDVEASGIDNNASMDTIENWDSLRHMNLIVSLEEEFDVVFSDEQMIDMISFSLIKITIEEALTAN